jgi:DNA-binding PadR family transcriptional regulator
MDTLRTTSSTHDSEVSMTNMNSSPVNGHPLTPAVFHILVALSDGDKHGYAIMKDGEFQTNGGLKLGPGTLYGTIKRLLAANLIKEVDERPDPELDDERRRYYRLTALGNQITSLETQRLEQAVKAARHKQVSTTALNLERPLRAAIGGMETDQ